MSNSDFNLDHEITEGLARSEKMLKQQRQIYRWLYVALGFCLLVIAFFLGYFLRPSNGSVTVVNNGIYFSSNRSGRYEIYYLGPDAQTLQITHTEHGQSWGAVVSPTGTIYFTSDRDGKREIYAFQAENVVRVTVSPGNSGSWDPIPTLGGLYFVSDRSGKNEIYFLDAAGSTHQVTNTPGSAGSLFSVSE